MSKETLLITNQEGLNSLLLPERVVDLNGRQLYATHVKPEQTMPFQVSLISTSFSPTKDVRVTTAPFKQFLNASSLFPYKYETPSKKPDVTITHPKSSREICHFAAGEIYQSGIGIDGYRIMPARLKQTAEGELGLDIVTGNGHVLAKDIERVVVFQDFRVQTPELEKPFDAMVLFK